MGGSCKALISFTLAEVLIVLGIIGLIADMTIPTLIQRTEEKVAVTRLKKAYSTLESAFRLAVANDDTPDNWDLIGYNEGEGATNMMAKISPHLNLLKNCGIDKGCMYSGSYYWLSRSESNIYDGMTHIAKAQLADGTYIATQVYNKDCKSDKGPTLAMKNTCGEVRVDINGDKPPNTWGKDLFVIYLTKYGMVPSGVPNEPEGSNSNFSTCNISTGTGWGCTAWVIYNENMDYLHCNDLSWEGKRSCN